MWRDNNYSSPLEPITLAQATQLGNALARRSDDKWQIHVAYEFREPLLSTMIRRLPSDEAVIVAPMYAADSAFTHALSRTTVEALDPRRPAPIVVLPPIDVDQLASASAHHVMHNITSEENDRNPATALVLAAHGTLLKPAKPIDTGLEATEKLRLGIENRLAASFGMVQNGWLNHSRGGKWTDPPIEEALKRVNDAGYATLSITRTVFSRITPRRSWKANWQCRPSPTCGSVLFRASTDRPSSRNCSRHKCSACTDARRQERLHRVQLLIERRLEAAITRRPAAHVPDIGIEDAFWHGDSPIRSRDRARAVVRRIPCLRFGAGV